MATKKTVEKTVAQAAPTLTEEEVSIIASDVMKRFFDLRTTPGQTKQRIRLALVTAMEDVLKRLGAKHG